MSNLRKIKAYVLGQTDTHVSVAELEDAHVPVSTEDCRGCANPCDQGHEEYPARFNVDLETQMFGSVKEYRRQIVISTGKSDWPRKVTDESNSLASFVQPLLSSAAKPVLSPSDAKKIPGIHNPLHSNAITILNGSHKSISDHPAHATVLVLPDYKVVSDVEHSLQGAQELWRTAVDPVVPRRGNVLKGGKLRSWVLPYSCVIMICSHKRRDNRCGISAPKLEHAFTSELEREGWEVHTQVEEPSGPALEEFDGTDEEKDEEIQRVLHTLDPRTADHRRALIVKNSHFGGHKFAGNVVIYTPQGAGIWYGRVTPHVVEAVVRETITKGRVLPPLLRGGVCLSQPGHDSLHSMKPALLDV
ncbi:Sucrase/ferredoxin-like-domain-containing protein [Cristinia sonorae]|uniref:Sucrase/ferredoxin-like-domain-containing protein n=1 Tax=Cristinia sonorae TaxID=1940300 RepID=A0A8K0UVT8_9AGAR|nr:Sucrase/ferredoxin-like-domain-containing protein [Cristinia sonorae]